MLKGCPDLNSNVFADQVSSASMTSKQRCASMEERKATTLLILNRHKIDAEDLRLKILGKAFPPSDWATVEKWLTK